MSTSKAPNLPNGSLISDASEVDTTLVESSTYSPKYSPSAPSGDFPITRTKSTTKLSENEEKQDITVSGTPQNSARSPSPSVLVSTVSRESHCRTPPQPQSPPPTTSSVLSPATRGASEHWEAVSGGTGKSLVVTMPPRSIS